MSKNIISVTPVQKYSAPKYPTSADAQCAPLLLRKLPSSWKKNATVAAAVGMLGAITLTSCGLFEPANKGYNPGSENFLNVAPVFIHGEGTGSMGCVMIAPPVFLSEEEALAIIKSVAESGGLNFSATPPEYIATNNKPEPKSQYSWENEKYVLGEGTVGLNLYDGKKGVAVAYISMEEAEEIYPDGPWFSVTGYQPKRLAELTIEDFEQQKGDIAIGVFYDPGTDWGSEEVKQIIDDYHAKSNEVWKAYYNESKQRIDEENLEEFQQNHDEAQAEYEENIKQFAAENLRNQVRDFIEWLQGQGII